MLTASPTPSPSAYTKAGVNLKLGQNVKANLPRLLKRATRPEVLGKVGAFGGLFRARFPRLSDPILVASMDGVGTKLRVAVEMGNHQTVGEDLVNHCCNDIAVMGADPLFFLDYIGTGKLEKEIFERVISGLAEGCAKAGIALLGGETAQMPGFYQGRDYDLVGTIIGVVDRKHILDGSKVRPGNVVIGLKSTGLHTNGYTLARKALFDDQKLNIHSLPPELGGVSVGEALLAVHRNYHPLLARLRKKKISIHAAAHITGGGFQENILRVIPKQCQIRIQTDSWQVPRIFLLIQRAGDVSDEEMYRVFNMGIGMILIAPQNQVDAIVREARSLQIGTSNIGEVTKGPNKVILE
jgi:phosphoribosylformylglycinamidine cyclo-ligase